MIPPELRRLRDDAADCRLFLPSLFARAWERACTSPYSAAVKEESDQLLKYLYARAATPEYQCRFRWAPGSLAFWDNRACQHYAASDYFPNIRIMERVTIAGDKPYYSG